MAFDNKKLARILKQEYRDTKTRMNELFKVTSEALTVIRGLMDSIPKLSILLPEEMEVANEEIKDICIRIKELTLLETYWEEVRAGMRYFRMDISQIRKTYTKIGCSIHMLGDMEIWRKLCEAIVQGWGEHVRTLSKMYERIEEGVGCSNHVNMLRRNTEELKSAMKILIFLRSKLKRIIYWMSIASVMLFHKHKRINEYLEGLKAEEKLRVPDWVSELVKRLNISCDYTVPEEVNAVGCQIYADEMESAIIYADRMVTGDNSNTGKAIARESGILTDKGLAIEGAEYQEKSEKELRKCIPEMQNYSDMKRSFIEIRAVVSDTLNVLRLHMDSFHCVSIHKSMLELIFESKERKLVNIQIKELMVLKTYMEEFRTAMHKALKGLLWTMKIYKEISCPNHILSDMGRCRRLCVEIDEALAVLGPKLQTMYELMYPEFKWLEVEERIRCSNDVELLKNYKKELKAARQILIVLWPKLKNIYDLIYNAMEVLCRTRERIYEYPERLKAEAHGWSQLPDDLIQDIVNRLTFKDFAACLWVSHNWRSVCSNMNYAQCPQLPRLMLSETPNSNRRFHSLHTNECFELQLPMLRGSRCYGTAPGWIITVGPDFKAHLFHPLRQDMIELPGLNALQKVGGLTDWFNVIHKFIAVKISHDKFLVVAIFGSCRRLAHTESGSSEWFIVENEMLFHDVSFFQGDYYALSTKGVLKLCELLGQDSITHFLSLPPISVKIPAKMYLVGSCGKLFLVFRYRSFNVSEKMYKTINFQVYEFQPNPADRHQRRWTRVKDLEDCAFFVGDSESLSICGSDAVSYKRNCIYFTDDDWGLQKTGRDIGVFDMTSQEIKCLNYGDDSPSNSSRSIWLPTTLR